MHIILVSQCEKKAWPNSRRILDSYGRRIGGRTWATPITQEGLSKLHGMMKGAETRQTAVACYQNLGLQRMKLLWIVGSRAAFSPDGYAPVAIEHKLSNPPAPWFRDVCLLAQASGYVHDWGKSSQDFADKLSTAVADVPRNEPFVDTEAVRHEWLSYCLYKSARDHGFDNAWLGAASETKVKDLSSLKKGISDKQKAIEFLVISHHRLMGKSSITIDSEGHVKRAIPVGGVKPVVDKSGALVAIDQNLFADAERLIASAGDQVGQDYWFMISVIARACLILADHQISSVDYQDQHGKPSEDVIYANTKFIDHKQARKRYDQPLNWHLRSVGEKAAEIAHNLSMTSFDGLSQVTIESILEKSRDKRFNWQDKAADFLTKHRTEFSGPSLVFSSAGTGAGKTRGNAKTICALSVNPRFCVALNLRSLTMQTGDSLRKDLKIMPTEMAVVIGDRVSEQLHRGSQDAFSIDGEDDSEIEVVGEEQPIPEWLRPYSTKSKSNQLLMPPVLVSTIDFIINASEPGRQGHHALAMLRVMNSDLVLDELDSYDPKAMVAVLRLIQMSSMLGRNVVCSSATLSVPVASAVYQAFMTGVGMLKAADVSAGKPLVAFIDDLLDPEIVEASDADLFTPIAVASFEASLKTRHVKMIEALQDKPIYRLPIIAKIQTKTPECYFETIKQAVDQLHQAHKWSIGPGKVLSFGLIRVANISSALEIARYLNDAYAGAGVKIACYHSNDLKIQRHMKEQRLDFLLSRKGGTFKHIANDKGINAAFSDTVKSVPFILIATPVEEVGRDHDFDWAVVEPSSAQSIVQTCGRVNRHRLEPVSTPNVVLMDYNLKAIRTPGQACFLRPGLESNLKIASLRYSSQQVSVLIGDLPLTRIDASFRLGTRPMALDENRITANRLKEGLCIIRRDKGFESSWMTNEFYKKYPLRDITSKTQFRFIPDDETGRFMLQQMTNSNGNGNAWVHRAHTQIPQAECGWLTWTDEELVARGNELGIEPEDSMFMEVASYDDEAVLTLVRDTSFGFILKKDS